MTRSAAARLLVIERELPHPPEKGSGALSLKAR